jgi:putative phosphoesterase
MKILVVSDIHFPDRRKNLPTEIENLATSADFIFALGDFTTIEVLNYLNKFGKRVLAVQGNMDEGIIKKALPKTRITKINGVRIGLFHGNGGPQNIEKRVKNAFGNKNLDAYIFGHSHVAMNKHIDGKLYFNPGSLCGTNKSVGILEVDFDNIWGKIVKIN